MRLHQGVRRHLGMRRHGADNQRTILDPNAAQAGNVRKVDHTARRAQPLLHGGDQRHAAGEKHSLRIVAQ